MGIRDFGFRGGLFLNSEDLGEQRGRIVKVNGRDVTKLSGHVTVPVMR